jgi:hypothetical protein
MFLTEDFLTNAFSSRTERESVKESSDRRDCERRR